MSFLLPSQLQEVSSTECALSLALHLWNGVAGVSSRKRVAV